MRVTLDMLQKSADRINVSLGMELSPYKQPSEGKGCTPNDGTYFVEGSFGLVSLSRMNKCGGVTNVLGGSCSKRELHSRMIAFLDGIYAERLSVGKRNRGEK